MMKKCKRLLALLLAVCMILPVFPVETYAANGASIASVPAVQSTTENSGSFTLTGDARFYIVADSDQTGTELGTYVQTVNSEFAAKKIPSAEVLPIVYGPEKDVTSGDIVIKIDSTLDAQGYTLDITADNIVVTGGSNLGVLYGLHTVLQSMVSKGTTLQAAVVSDYPDTEERSLYLDAGRIFYSVDLIKSIIRTLSWNKMNTLYLDFSNNNATRFFLDDTKVTVNGAEYDISGCKPSDGSWTEADMDAILDCAKAYGVNVIPTFNSPGHIGGLKTVSSAWFMTAAASDYDAEVGKITLDLSNADAYAFGQAVTKKYVDYFVAKGCTDFNIAADEAAYTNGNAMDSTDSNFVTYVNDLNTYIKSKGMVTRMFNDGIKSVEHGIAADIVILYWAPATPNANAYLDAGYKLVNFSYTAGLYYAYLGSINGWWVWNQPVSGIYSGWTPSAASRNTDNSSSYIVTETVDTENSGFLGANFAVWSDYAYTEGISGDTMFAKNSYNMMEKILIVGEKGWSDENTKTESDWLSSVTTAPAGVDINAQRDTTALPAASSILAAEAVIPAYKDEAANVTVKNTTEVITSFVYTLLGTSDDNYFAYTMQTSGDRYAAYDIKLNDGNYTGSATVTMPIPEGMMTVTGVYVEAANGGYEACTNVSTANGLVTFTAPHFSTVVIEGITYTYDVQVDLQAGQTSGAYELTQGVESATDYDEASRYTITRVQDEGGVVVEQIDFSSDAQPVIIGNNGNYIKLESGTTGDWGSWNTTVLGVTTDPETATEWTIDSLQQDGSRYSFKLKSGNQYLNYNNGSLSLSSRNSITFYYQSGYLYFYANNSTAYYLNYSSSGWTAEVVDTSNWNASTQGFIVGESEAIDESSVVFTGITPGISFWEIDGKVYYVNVSEYHGNGSVGVKPENTITLTATSLPSGFSLDLSDVSANAVVDNGVISYTAGADEGFDTVTVGVVNTEGIKVGTYTWNITISENTFNIPNSIEIPIEIIDYRADGLLFDHDPQDKSYGYSLVHIPTDRTNSNDKYDEAVDAISETTLQWLPVGGHRDNGTVDETSAIALWNNFNEPKTGRFVRTGLVKDSLGSDGMPVYTDAAVQYVAGLLEEGIYRNRGENWNAIIVEDFIENGKISNTSTTAMSTEFSSNQTYENITNAYDLAYYLLNNLYAADSNYRDVTDTITGATYNVPIYGMADDTYDRIFLKQTSDAATGETYYEFTAYGKTITYDETNAALYNTDGNSGEFFYPLANKGYDAYFGDTTDMQKGNDTVGDYYPNQTNGNFTLRGEAQFVYNSADNLYFTFIGDDDVYLFINGQLALDMGGAHWPLENTVYLNDVATQCGLVEGQAATFTFFYMERNADASNFSIRTNITLSNPAIMANKNAYQVKDENLTATEVSTGTVLDNNTTIAYDLSVTNSGANNMTNIKFIDTDNDGNTYVFGYDEVSATEGNDNRASEVSKLANYIVTITNQNGTTAATTELSSDSDLRAYLAGVILAPGQTLHLICLKNRMWLSDTGVEGYTNNVYVSASSGGQVLGANATHSVLVANPSIEAQNLTYVLDYGLPVTFDNLFAENEATYLSSVSVTTNKTQYGTITTQGTGAGFAITYTPDALLEGVDRIVMNVEYSVAGKVAKGTKTIFVIPATTVYYEEGWATYGETWNVTGGGNWTSKGNKGTESQTASKAGSTDNYNYDNAYSDNRAASNGSSASSATAADTLMFNFVGTGVDIFANATEKTRWVTIQIRNSENKIEKLITVDTKLNGDYAANMTNAYNTPIASVSGLTYGSHKVTIYVSAAGGEDNIGFDFDGFRVYNPMGSNSAAQAAYTSDLEENPEYYELRNAVLAGLDVEQYIDPEKVENLYAKDIAKSIYAQVYATGEVGNGALVFGASADGESADSLLNDGPKNELYLKAGQSVVFKLNTNRQAQIGLRSVTGADVKYTITGKDGVQTLSSSVDMFYDLQAKGTTAGEAYTITVTDGILSVTDIKISDFVEETVFGTLTEADIEAALLAMGYENEPAKVFEPKTFDVRLDNSVVREGKRVRLTVRASEDVESILVNGEEKTSYKVVKDKTYPWNKQEKKTYRQFTFVITENEAGTYSYDVVACDAEGVESEAKTVTLKVTERNNNKHWN